jgi:hypothetical protein
LVLHFAGTGVLYPFFGSCWIWLGVALLVLGTGWFKAQVNPYATWNYPVPELHNLIQKAAPVAVGCLVVLQAYVFTGMVLH